MNTEMISIVVGGLMPMLIEAINNYVPDNQKARYLISLLVSVLVGFATTYLIGDFNTNDLLGSIGLVFISSQTAYRVWFKGSSVEQSFQR
ncbi:MAG: hypothetical protein KAX49_19845 [Halanaerobiales bacterium]|nr:hypothetical protein [Halanaerobiales bacterium]